MLKQSPNRIQRSRAFKVNNVIHTCLMFAICVWLLYQMNNHQSDPKSRKEEHIAGAGVGIVKLGRRDLRPKHDSIITAEKDEREDLEEEEEGRGGGDDEIDGLDQEKEEEEEEEEEAVDFEDLNSSEMENDEADHDVLSNSRHAIAEDERVDEDEEQSIREVRVVSRAKRFVSNSSSLIKTNPDFNATSYSSTEAVLSGESSSMGLKILTRKENSDVFYDYDDDEEEDLVTDSSDF